MTSASKFVIYGHISYSLNYKYHFLALSLLILLLSLSQLFQGYGPPENIISLGSQQFMRNLNAMKGEYNDEFDFGESGTSYL
jgi:hypothetical protein